MITNMKAMLRKAREEHYAVTAINTQGGNYDISWAFCEAAARLHAPIILAHYDSCSEYAGIEFFVEISKWCANKVDVPVAIHLDHGGSVELCMHAIDLGFTSVMYDGSMLPLDENIRNTNEIIRYASKHDVSVEAEVGSMKALACSGSEALRQNVASLDDVRRFVASSSPDALAVAIGNAHGFYADDPQLDFGVLKGVEDISPIPLVLHGGTGISDDDIRRCISLGIAKCNFGTEIRCAYVRYIYQAINDMGLSEHAWKISKRAIDRLSADIEHKIRVTGSQGKA